MSEAPLSGPATSDRARLSLPHDSAIGYRPEIDGLRALAVVPVVLFHADFRVFSGGYVGVDVFFVISGYLITSIILQELTQGRFTILGFYERRARRILPALFLVMLACIPLAWLWMTPHHLKGFSQSLVAATMFAPNVYFLLKSGYFEADAAEIPMLHTWSLGVEEQYYILFPLFMLLFWQIGRRKLVALIAGIAFMSLSLSEWASHGNPQGNFFLPMTRAWELALGALVAIDQVAGSQSVRWPPKVNSALALLGLAAILLSVFLYDQTTRIPGLHALLPTLGAALVIAFGRGNSLVARLLSMKWVVGIGLISYSVYLWHQPLFAFARLHSTHRPSPAWMGLLCMLSIVLGYLSWRFVERPVRDRHRLSQRQVFTIAGLVSLVIVSLGLAGHVMEGFPGRLTIEQQRILAIEDDPTARHSGFPQPPCFLALNVDGTQFGKCTESPANAVGSIFLVGDSHAAHLLPGLRQRLEGKWSLTTLTASACPPMPNSGSAACRSVYANVMARVRQEHPDRVIIAAVWGHYDWRRLAQTMQDLRQAGVTRIEVVGPVPRWNPSLPIVLLRYNRAFADLPWRSTLALDPSISELDIELGRLVRQQGGNYISAWGILCNVEGCQVRVGTEPASMMQWDVSHLTAAGSHHLVAGFRGPDW